MSFEMKSSGSRTFYLKSFRARNLIIGMHLGMSRPWGLTPILPAVLAAVSRAIGPYYGCFYRLGDQSVVVLVIKERYNFGSILGPLIFASSRSSLVDHELPRA